jgi:basic amino acid/polyamine antiporter, APA family
MNNPQQLNRSLGLTMVIVVVIGNIIGSGVYKKVAPMAAELHSPGWVLICWVLGGIISLFGAPVANMFIIKRYTTAFLLLFLDGHSLW